jgi:hypothetical protein
MESIINELQSRLEPSKRIPSKFSTPCVIPRIVCKDGFSLSVQARESAYCTPRDDRGPWTAVEVGFPSEKVEKLMGWAEEPGRPTETIYGWVPIETVAEIISDHGGIA